MAILAWGMMGIALWHFTIWVPDRFWGGIVGAFVGALIGAFVSGFIIAGFTVPSRHDTHISTALAAVPGAALGIAAIYFVGMRREKAGLQAPAPAL